MLLLLLLMLLVVHHVDVLIYDSWMTKLCIYVFRFVRCWRFTLNFMRNCMNGIAGIHCQPMDLAHLRLSVNLQTHAHQKSHKPDTVQYSTVIYCAILQSRCIWRDHQPKNHEKHQFSRSQVHTILNMVNKDRHGRRKECKIESFDRLLFVFVLL